MFFLVFVVVVVVVVLVLVLVLVVVLVVLKGEVTIYILATFERNLFCHLQCIIFQLFTEYTKPNFTS